MYFKNSNRIHKYKTHPTYPCRHLLFQWFINVINFRGSHYRLLLCNNVNNNITYVYIQSHSFHLLVKVTEVQLCLCNPRTVAHLAPLSLSFSRQEYWSGQPFASLGDLPDSGIGPGSPALQADSLPPGQPPGKPPHSSKWHLNAIAQIKTLY